MTTTHVFHMPNGSYVVKTSSDDAIDFIREQVRLGCRLIGSYYRNSQCIYELR